MQFKTDVRETESPPPPITIMFFIPLHVLTLNMSGGRLALLFLTHFHPSYTHVQSEEVKGGLTSTTCIWSFWIKKQMLIYSRLKQTSCSEYRCQINAQKPKGHKDAEWHSWIHLRYIYVCWEKSSHESNRILLPKELIACFPL